ncbi:SpoIIE family protein phosphatase [Terasakiella sp. SH-1]|uniref:SpoIIE family protein phosphatase n=1 Tax=Terasakiella sp. SH-1 TaxID=2560057 RepID=UPI0010736932|nr:SpoIIE family protein phosphatase [Terasakiella sp. SH-1]
MEKIPANISKQINLLATMTAEFANTLNVDETLHHALREITDYLEAEGGAVFLLDETSQIISCVTCCGATEITGLTLEYGQGIVGKSVADNKGALVRDVQNDPNFYGAVDDQTGFTTRSILCAPLSVKDRCVGAIELVNKKNHDDLFAENDLKVLETLAASAALAVINARMAKALVEQERVKRELELAAEIQRRFLPDSSAHNEDQIIGVNKAARGVSGDFFDYFTLPDGRIYFALGDVSGKGINAALLMSKTASLFRCLGKTVRDPGKLLGRINAELCETAAHGMFVTMVAGLYDPRPGCEGLIRLANAGHEPVLLQKEGEFETFGADGPPLGIVPPLPGDDGDYEEIQIFPNGGGLFIYTDGLTEGYTQNGDPLDATGVRDLLSQYSHLPLKKQLDHLISAVSPNGMKLRDDVTILALTDSLRSDENSEIKASQNDINHTEERDGDWLIDFKFPARPSWMKLARACVSEACKKVGCDEQTVNDVVLAVDEACQNVIRHAYGGPSDEEIELTVRQRPGRLVFRLRDFAPMVAPGEIKPRDLEDIRPGGLGTHLIQEVMDEVQYLRPTQGEGNLLRLVKHLELNKGEDEK